MINRPPPADNLYNRARNVGRNMSGVVVRKGWELVQRYGSIGPTSRAAKAFGSFGMGSVVCFPYEDIVNPYAMSIGSGTIVGKGAVLACGWGPGHEGLPPDMLRIGDRCLLGRGSSIVAHNSIVLEDDVWTGQQVHITDMNHGYVVIDEPISRQAEPDAPVRIGAGSWLGHHVVVLPGVTIGRHVVVGAGSIVTRDLPDFSVAVGSPARVVRRYLPDDGWVDVDAAGHIVERTKDGVAGLANLLGDLEAVDAHTAQQAKIPTT
jgi:acetyltransferase-like isoleucine patch superfamily enzyme